MHTHPHTTHTHNTGTCTHKHTDHTKLKTWIVTTVEPCLKTERPSENQAEAVFKEGGPWSGLHLCTDIKGKVGGGNLTRRVVTCQGGLSNRGPTVLCSTPKEADAGKLHTLLAPNDMLQTENIIPKKYTSGQKRPYNQRLYIHDVFHTI